MPPKKGKKAKEQGASNENEKPSERELAARAELEKLNDELNSVKNEVGMYKCLGHSPSAGLTLSKALASTRHTDNSRSPAPDIAVPRQALCYLSRSNRGLKNRRLFLQHPLFLALVNPGNHKPQNAEPSKRIINRALNKHRISQNQ